MRFIFILIIIIAFIIAGLSVLDYFGFYVNWDKSILSLSVLVPILKAIQSFFSNPFKEVKKINKRISNN